MKEVREIQYAPAPSTKSNFICHAAIDNRSSLHEFQECVRRGEPVVMRGMGQAERWKALQTCTPSGFFEYVNDAATPSSVRKLDIDVALNVEERNELTQKARTRLADFARTLRDFDKEECARKNTQVRNDHGVMASMGYLKQLDCGEIFAGKTDLFLDPVKKLWPDTISPTAFFWAGPAGCVTGLHSDDEKNILAQLYGQKRVTLVPEHYKKYLYANSKYDSGTTCCDIDVENPDLSRHPLFKKVIQDDALLTTTLYAGDVLFIPRNVFHQVTSVSTSMSANFFCSNWAEWIKEGVPRGIGICLHELGLWKSEHCVCHPHRSLGFSKFEPSLNSKLS